jgi:hypothetical protein
MYSPHVRANALKNYPTIATDKDLLADSATLAVAGQLSGSRPASYIVVGTAGDIVVKMAGGSQDTFYAAAGVPIYGDFVKIIASGTNAAKVTAFWSAL